MDSLIWWNGKRQWMVWMEWRCTMNVCNSSICWTYKNKETLIRKISSYTECLKGNNHSLWDFQKTYNCSSHSLLQWVMNVHIRVILSICLIIHSSVLLIVINIWSNVDCMIITKKSLSLLLHFMYHSQFDPIQVSIRIHTQCSCWLQHHSSWSTRSFIGHSPNQYHCSNKQAILKVFQSLFHSWHYMTSLGMTILHY